MTVMTSTTQCKKIVSNIQRGLTRKSGSVISNIALKTVTSHSLGILGFILEVFPETSYIQPVLRGHIHSLEEIIKVMPSIDSLLIFKFQ
uniref:Uncharacterized protein n=1 Tax=Astatotilapia calliptera TaxID=8154 RepID=A0AAX7VGF3_ASTCA